MNKDKFILPIVLSIYLALYIKKPFISGLQNIISQNIACALVYAVVIFYCFKLQPKARLAVFALILCLPFTRPFIIFGLNTIGCLTIGSSFSEKFSPIMYNLALDVQINKKIPNKPSIIMLNYPSSIFEYQVFHLLSNKIALVCRNKALAMANLTMRGIPIILSDNKEDGNFERVSKEVKDFIDRGYNIVMYPESGWEKLESSYSLAKLRSGFFRFSNINSIPITPVCVDRIQLTPTGIVLDNKFTITVGDTFIVENIEKEMEKVKKFFVRNLRRMSYR